MGVLIETEGRSSGSRTPAAFVDPEVAIGTWAV